MKTVVGIAAVTLTAGMTLGACGRVRVAAPQGNAPPAAGASCQWSKPTGSRGISSLSYCFMLHRSTIKAGTTAPATLTIRNSSGRKVTFGDGPTGAVCAVQVGVALRGPHVNVEPIFAADCAQPRTLATGMTTLKVPISAAYNMCTMTGPATASTPECVRAGVSPPVPAGTYTVSLVASDSDLFARVDPIRVRIIR